MTSPAWLRTVSVLLALIAGMAGIFVYRTYFSRYFFVMATRGAHGEESYEANLRQSMRMDPSYGHSHQMLARLMARRFRYGAAQQLQNDGMASFRTPQSFENMGRILSARGRDAEARSYLERASQMNPASVTALEQLASLAYRAGNSHSLEELTRQILRLDLNNLNALYLRAKDAERAGVRETALLNYQRISAGMNYMKGRKPESLLFKADEIRERLKELGGRAGNR